MERLKGKCLGNVYDFIVRSHGGISKNCTLTTLSGTFSWVYLWKRSRPSQRVTGIKAVILGMSQGLALVDGQHGSACEHTHALTYISHIKGGIEAEKDKHKEEIDRRVTYSQNLDVVAFVLQIAPKVLQLGLDLKKEM